VRTAPLLLALFLLAGCGKPTPPTTVAVYGGGDPNTGTGTKVKDGHATTFPPDDWTHKDLASYLEQKGVAVRVGPGGLWDKPARPAASFSRNDGEVVIVFLCADARAAKEAAAAGGESGFSFGRFAFRDYAQNGTNAVFLQVMQKALR
jgi:hypothetical protein